VLRISASPTFAIDSFLGAPRMLDPMLVEAPDSDYSNRRCFPRRAPRGTATMIADDQPGTAPVAVTLRNISQGGVGFISPQQVTVGQRIKISLRGLALSRPLTVAAEVRWVGYDKAQRAYRVGCSWVERLTYAHIILFV
jgi:PilZ domain